MLKMQQMISDSNRKEKKNLSSIVVLACEQIKS